MKKRKVKKLKEYVNIREIVIIQRMVKENQKNIMKI